jgi:HPt (histidine-containing phosphotransfer) domain-containing protein
MLSPDSALPPAAGATATPDESTVLDGEALRRLQELDPKGTSRLLERVFAAFAASTSRLLPQMKDALVAGDTGAVRHVAHTLKSSSASIGAIKLSQLCADIEAMIRLDTLEGLPAHVERADREAALVLQSIARFPLTEP